MVDWRRLLVTLAQPWTTPTPQQLVDTLTKYEAVGVRGRVSREQYQWTRTWLDESGEERDVQLKHVSQHTRANRQSPSVDTLLYNLQRDRLVQSCTLSSTQTSLCTTHLL